MKSVSIVLMIAMLAYHAAAQKTENSDIIITGARGVLERTIGNKASEIRIERLKSSRVLDTFDVDSRKGILKIRGNSVSAICYGFYTYLKKEVHQMVTWSSSLPIQVPAVWPECTQLKGSTPYHYRYYLNVVTFGYTTAYWNWNRWERELDWMALHGINMALAFTGSEAIASRVWQKLGLKSDQVDSFFTGPAYLPWYRMGNLNRWDGPLNEDWHHRQLLLQHKILNRMQQLGITPIAPAFAGFIPPGFKQIHPEIPLHRLKWGGFDTSYNAGVLSPQSPWFEKIGKLFIQEWEKEFGKNKYYLADIFNEMDVPVSNNNSNEKYAVLAAYGKAVYRSIYVGNPSAVWVMQGWAFGYQHRFWDPKSIKALLSGVPDRQMLILDLANEYPQYVWHTAPVWKKQNGFYGKDWIFSYVPNFGGKTAYTGVLSHYAGASAEALKSKLSTHLVGFGFAPEGIENNEIVYELLSDMGWQRDSLDMQQWGMDYCEARYGAVPFSLMAAGQKLMLSCYNSFSSYPRFVWQTVTFDQRRKGSVNEDQNFLWGVEDFLSAANEMQSHELYKNDAIELAMLYLGIRADQYYREALRCDSLGQTKLRDSLGHKTIKLLLQADTLLASHPIDRLDRWIEWARDYGTTISEKNVYESDAKRIITTWGGAQSDYAARLWSGLIRDYYVPRIENRLWNHSWNQKEWEEQWVKTQGISKIVPYKDPLQKAVQLVKQNTINN